MKINGLVSLKFIHWTVQFYYPSIKIQYTKGGIEFFIQAPTCFRYCKYPLLPTRDGGWEIGFQIVGFGFGVGYYILPQTSTNDMSRRP
jgi:hypothetical protein